jgi:hypothetical protein
MFLEGTMDFIIIIIIMLLVFYVVISFILTVLYVLSALVRHSDDC